MRVAVIIVAAGRGERAPSRPDKVLQLLGGERVIARATSPFLKDERVCQIIVVSPAGREDGYLQAALPGGWPAGIRASAVAGGARRRDSVARGLQAVSDDVDLVAVHDAARPLVSSTEIGRLIDAAARTGAAVPVLPLADTVVTVSGEGDRLAGTLDRGRLRRVQTPQVFRRTWLEEAHRSAAAERREYTDDASMVRSLGHPVACLEGRPDNIKLTSEEDFLTAEALLGRRP